MSEQTQFEITFNPSGAPPSTPKRESAKGKSLCKNIFSSEIDAISDSPVKKQKIEEVVTSQESQNGAESIAYYRNRQFEITSPVKNAVTVTPPAVMQILNIEEEVIAFGAENKVTKMTIRYHEGSSTNLIIRQNHKGRDPINSPLADLIQAQHHPLIAKRLDKTPGVDDDGFQYVRECYEYCAGSLTDIPISYADIPAFFLAIIGGVKWLHSKGCAHLDLKPDNILVGFDGLPKIADLDNLQSLKGIINNVTGTKSYMPPDVTTGIAEEEKNGRAVDAWPLGGILYYLYMREAPPLTDKGEFVGFTEEMKKKFVSKSPNAFRAINIIEKLLSTDPAKRLRMLAKIKDKKLFANVDKTNLSAYLQHGKNLSEIYNIERHGSYSEQLAKYQEMCKQCDEINPKNIDQEQQNAIDDEAPYTALRTLLRSKELATFKDDQFKEKGKSEWTQTEKKNFFNNKEIEFLGLHLEKTVEEKKQELSEKAIQLKREKKERTEFELDQLIFEAKIKVAITTRFKDKETFSKKIIDYKIPEAKGSGIPTKEEWAKNFSRGAILIDTLFDVNNKFKHFGLYITRYHSAKTLADKIKWALNLLNEIQAYPKANQIKVLEDLRLKVLAEIQILHKDHRLLSPEIQRKLKLNIPQPIKVDRTPCKVVGQVEEDNLISERGWFKASEKFYIHWLNFFKIGRKDIEVLDRLVRGYSQEEEVRERFKYARDIMITAEHWLTTHKSNVRYEVVEELQRCAIYTFNSLLRSLRVDEQGIATLLVEPLARTTEDVNEQAQHKTNRSRFFSCFGRSNETTDLPTVTP